MKRPEAQAIVDDSTVKVEQYKAVALANARHLLGEERYAAMMRDRLRCAGPREGFVYPWNVVDYLDDAGPFPTKSETRCCTASDLPSCFSFAALARNALPA